jgi:hypothetical protein
VEDGGNEFPLQETSPCAETDECGQLGAWPVGCESVSSLLTSFAAQAQDDWIQVTWRIVSLASPPTFRLTWAPHNFQDDEAEIPYLDEGDGRYSSLLNTSAIGSEGYVFRLYVQESEFEWVLLDEASIQPPPGFAGIRQLGAWPNPFNPQTNIRFNLGRQQQVRLAVFDIDGRLVRILADQVMGSGEQNFTWDGRNQQGRLASSGTYILLVEGQHDLQTQKLMLLK